MVEKKDIIIIGGGINGVAIAGQAARLGLKVVLIEQNDLASGTSSKSTQLIHGGLRYLQQYYFSLVKKALHERSLLIKMAPHLIKPVRFIIPYYKESALRRLVIRIGLFIYDHLSAHKGLEKAKSIRLNVAPYRPFFKKSIKSGAIYSDAWTHDSRLVVEWALLAKQYQATILTYHTILELTEAGSGWQVVTEDKFSQQCSTYKANILINATGPWVEQFQKHYLAEWPTAKLRLVKGSHLVLKRELPDNKAYLFECADGRVIFLTPYEPGYCLLGTTELEYHGPLDDHSIEPAEIEYLLAAANAYMQTPFERQDIATTFSGIRPLLDDEIHNAHQLSRDYQLQLQTSVKGNSVLTVLGGKLTTHRRLALDALILLQKIRPCWPAIKDETIPLPGSDLLDEVQFRQDYSFMPMPVLSRYLRCYGTLCLFWLRGKNILADLGIDFGAGLYQVEVDYLLAQEWVKSVDDLLWRRTRLGLCAEEIDVGRLKEYIQRKNVYK
ncbi:MAG: glpA [Gammaproteobacteria bacterium]|jgi:glycerol-3-phosphate dehydrogenase|nr:glpA [Gammaproteobacteria bacterium]